MGMKRTGIVIAGLGFYLSLALPVQAANLRDQRGQGTASQRPTARGFVPAGMASAAKWVRGVAGKSMALAPVVWLAKTVIPTKAQAVIPPGVEVQIDWAHLLAPVRQGALAFALPVVGLLSGTITGGLPTKTRRRVAGGVGLLLHAGVTGFGFANGDPTIIGGGLAGLAVHQGTYMLAAEKAP